MVTCRIREAYDKYLIFPFFKRNIKKLTEVNRPPPQKKKLQPAKNPLAGYLMVRPLCLPGGRGTLDQSEAYDISIELTL